VEAKGKQSKIKQGHESKRETTREVESKGTRGREWVNKI
jgi:hypothetical protein